MSAQYNYFEDTNLETQSLMPQIIEISFHKKHTFSEKKYCNGNPENLDFNNVSH